MEDMQLVRSYAETGSQEAFSELVNRHIGWVYAVCLRGVRDRHLAEDVAQAVFILLARKAPLLNENTILRGWLFKTSRFAVADALKKRQRELRRLETYRQLSESHLTEQEEAAWDDLAPILDEAVSCLSTNDRQAVLLRFYEGKSLAEIGEQLEISEEAAKKRVSRAVDRLRGILSHDGANITAAVLLGLLLVRTTAAAPTGLPAAVISIGCGKISASSSVLGIAEGARLAMIRAARRLLAAIVASAATLLLVIGLVLGSLVPSTPRAAVAEIVVPPRPQVQAAELDLKRVSRVFVGTHDAVLMRYRPGDVLNFDWALVPVSDGEPLYAVVIDTDGHAWSRQLPLTPQALAGWDSDATPLLPAGDVQKPDEAAAVLSLLLGDAPLALTREMPQSLLGAAPALPEPLSVQPLDAPAPSGGWIEHPTQPGAKGLIVDDSPLPLEGLFKLQSVPDSRAPGQYVNVPEPTTGLLLLAAATLLRRRRRRHHA